jgi:hypothetical protein
MSQNKSPWLSLVQRLERAIGVPVETAVRSDAYFDLLTHATRVRKQLGGTFETMSAEWLSLFNLPAGSEIRKLREQVSRMERELAELSKSVGESRQDGERPFRDAPAGGDEPADDRVE